jgi:PPK2 family polyphosphate:nucleotide phosphotransferase
MDSSSPAFRRIIDALRVSGSRGFSLKRHATNWTGGLDKDGARELLEQGVERLAAHQARLYAHDTYAVLLIFQAMDAAGKDSTIKHVMSGVNPQGCQVFSFKAPSAEERDHGYLWRSVKALPERGRIGIHNRSYYEEVLVVRVHPELLSAQQLPKARIGAGIWTERFRQINEFERYLVETGTIPIKFFLHVSREEQRRRFLDRIDDRDENWKFSLRDVQERQHWGAYMRAYEEAIRHTSTPDAPWYVIPADHKWFTRVAVAEIINQRLAALDLHFPRATRAHRAELLKARKLLTMKGK